MFVASSEPPLPTNPYGQVPHASTSPFASQDFPTSNKDINILAYIYPPSGVSPPVPSQAGFPPQHVSVNGSSSQAGQHVLQTQFPPQTPLQHNNFVAQSGFPGQPAAVPSFTGQSNPVMQTGFAGPTTHSHLTKLLTMT